MMTSDPLTVNARIRFRSNLVVHVKRQIPPQSKINVSVRDEVTPSDIIAEGTLPVGFRIVRLATELNISPGDGMKYLKPKIGSKIFQGELLGEKSDFFGFKKIIVRSPIDGVVDFYDANKGELKILLPAKDAKVVSGMFGVVDFIDKPNGEITIKTLATLVYGVIGSGREREGNICILGDRSMLVSSKQILTTHTHKILIGGSLTLVESLQRSVGIEVAGLITGGINAREFKAMTGGSWNIFNKRWTDVGVSLLVTEGFGSIPIGRDLFGLFQAHNDKFAILDGNNSTLILPSSDESSMISIRKTNLSTNPSFISPYPSLEVVNLKIGSKVRILSGSMISHQGEILSVDQNPTLLPSGISVIMITVATSSNQVKIPFMNVEIIG